MSRNKRYSVAGIPHPVSRTSVGFTRTCVTPSTPPTPDPGGDIYFIQAGATVNGPILTTENIVKQTRTSYPNGALDPDGITLVRRYNDLDITARLIGYIEAEELVVIAGPRITDTTRHLVYTINPDTAVATLIYESPSNGGDPFQNREINGLAINNTGSGNPIWISQDHTSGLLFNGFIYSMDSSGGNFTQVNSVGFRGGSALSISERLNQVCWNGTNGIHFFTLDPFGFLCTVLGNRPLNSRTSGFDGRNGWIYNLDAFGTLDRSPAGSCQTPGFVNFGSILSPAFEELVYSDLTDEICIGGSPGRLYYDVSNSANNYIVGQSQAMIDADPGPAETVGCTAITVRQGGTYPLS